jgi:hypothetical protein
MDLQARLYVNVLEGSCVDKPLAVGYNLGTIEILIVFCLSDLGMLVLEDLVDAASLSGIWNQ